MAKNTNKKTLKNSQEENDMVEENDKVNKNEMCEEEEKPKKASKTVSVGLNSNKKKNWQDNQDQEDQEDEETNYNQEENDEHYVKDTEAVSDPEENYMDRQKRSSSILDSINVKETEELDKNKLNDLSNQDLFKVLYVRGLKQQNPTVYHTARKALLELSLGSFRNDSGSRYNKNVTKRFNRGGMSNSRGSRPMRGKPNFRKP